MGEKILIMSLACLGHFWRMQNILLCTNTVKIVKMNGHNIVTNQKATIHIPKMCVSRCQMVHRPQTRSKAGSLKCWKQEYMGRCCFELLTQLNTELDLTQNLHLPTVRCDIISEVINCILCQKGMSSDFGWVSIRTFNLCSAKEKTLYHKPVKRYKLWKSCFKSDSILYECFRETMWKDTFLLNWDWLIPTREEWKW